MRYRISYDDSADKYSARRFSIEVSEHQLARRIAWLQASGSIIYEVTQAGN